MLGVRSGSLVQGGSQVWCVNVAPQSLQWKAIRDRATDYPHDCEYVSCTFENPVTSNTNNNLTSDMFDYSGDFVRRFSGQTFKWCKFVQQNVSQPSWCIFLTLITDDSDASFEECSFTNKNAFELIKNEEQVSSSELVLAFDTCTFDSLSDPNWRYAFLFEEDSFGQCSIAHSTFITDNPNNPQFADDQAQGFTVVQADNHIEGH